MNGQDGGSCGDGLAVNVEGNLWSQYVFSTYHRGISVGNVGNIADARARGGYAGAGRRAMSLNRLPGLSPSNAVYTLLQNPTLTTTAALAGHRCKDLVRDGKLRLSHTGRDTIIPVVVADAALLSRWTGPE